MYIIWSHQANIDDKASRVVRNSPDHFYVCAVTSECKRHHFSYSSINMYYKGKSASNSHCLSFRQPFMMRRPSNFVQMHHILYNYKHQSIVTAFLLSSPFSLFLLPVQLLDLPLIVKPKQTAQARAMLALELEPSSLTCSQDFYLRIKTLMVG